MNLNREHLALACAAYGRIRAENPLLTESLPPNPLWIRWHYLPWNRWKCYGEARECDHGPIVAINPMAFERGWDIVLEGIVNHELVHLLIPEVGHHDPFSELESAWPRHDEFRLALEKFRKKAEMLAIDRTIVHEYKCPECEQIIRVDRILPRGTACKMCCIKVSRGHHNPQFELIYVGRTRLGHGRDRNDQDQQETQQQRIEAGNP